MRSTEPPGALRALRERMPSPLPNVYLVSRGESAEDALVATWLPVVLGWCTRLGGPHVDAEDAAHDILLTVLAKVGDLRDPAAIRAFVFGITRRTLAARRRRAWIRRWVGPIDREPAHHDPSPEASAEAQELAAAVSAALELLSADHREIIVLVDLEERSLTEAAELIGAPVGTAKSRLFRAREAFRAAARRTGLEEP